MSEEQKIRVVIADDQELVRAGFAMVIGSQPDIAGGVKPDARWRGSGGFGGDAASRRGADGRAYARYGRH